ncbi:beta-tectorin, partial [Striga asiatica]
FITPKQRIGLLLLKKTDFRYQVLDEFSDGQRKELKANDLRLYPVKRKPITTKCTSHNPTISHENSQSNHRLTLEFTPLQVQGIHRLKLEFTTLQVQGIHRRIPPSTKNRQLTSQNQIKFQSQTKKIIKTESVQITHVTDQRKECESHKSPCKLPINTSNERNVESSEKAR